MKRIILLLHVFVCLTSSAQRNKKDDNSVDTTNLPVYTACYVDDSLTFYESDDTTLPHYTIKSGGFIILNKEDGIFREINYGGQPGYILNRKFRNERQYRTAMFLQPVKSAEYLVRRKKREEDELKNRQSLTASSAIFTRDSTLYMPTYNGGPVHVDGYYRKNGTYVKPHTRNAPRRRN